MRDGKGCNRFQGWEDFSDVFPSVGPPPGFPWRSNAGLKELYCDSCKWPNERIDDYGHYR